MCGFCEISLSIAIRSFSALRRSCWWLATRRKSFPAFQPNANPLANDIPYSKRSRLITGHPTLEQRAASRTWLPARAVANSQAKQNARLVVVKSAQNKTTQNTHELRVTSYELRTRSDGPTNTYDIRCLVVEL